MRNINDKIMNEKEKAKELVDNFTYNYREYDNAKNSALICVNEIISIKTLWYQKDTKEIDYWKNVKKEIELL